MTFKPSTVTFKRDTSSVTERDTSRAHALLKEGCHGVTPRDVTHRDVTLNRDSHGHRPGGRDSQQRCTDCQVGQGENCACRDASPRVPILLGLTALEWVWVILVADVACVAALVALVTWWAR